MIPSRISTTVPKSTFSESKMSELKIEVDAKIKAEWGVVPIRDAPRTVTRNGDEKIDLTKSESVEFIRETYDFRRDKGELEIISATGPDVEFVQELGKAEQPDYLEEAQMHLENAIGRIDVQNRILDENQALRDRLDVMPRAPTMDSLIYDDDQLEDDVLSHISALSSLSGLEDDHMYGEDDHRYDDAVADAVSVGTADLRLEEEMIDEMLSGKKDATTQTECNCGSI